MCFANRVELNLDPAIRVVVHPEREDLVAVREQSFPRANCGTADPARLAVEPQRVEPRAQLDRAKAAPPNAAFLRLDRPLPSSRRSATQAPRTYQALPADVGQILVAQSLVRRGCRPRSMYSARAPTRPVRPVERRSRSAGAWPFTNIGSKKVYCDITVRPRSPLGRNRLIGERRWSRTTRRLPHASEGRPDLRRTVR